MNKLLFASLLLVFVVGCKKGPVVVVKSAAPVQPQAGEAIAESSDKTVAIIVPSGWKRGGPGSMSGPSMSEMLGSVEGGGVQEMAQGMQREESAEDATTAAELEKQGTLIWVNDSSRHIPGETRTHYRVKLKKDGPMSLEDAANAAKEDLLNEGPVQYVELPIGKAARLEAKTTKVDGGELFQVAYVVVNGEDIYDIRFSTQNPPSSVTAVEKQVMDSLRITPAKS